MVVSLRAFLWISEGRGVCVVQWCLSGAGRGATVCSMPAKVRPSLVVTSCPGSSLPSMSFVAAPSGTFLDGFVRFTSRTDQPSLSCLTWASTATGQAGNLRRTRLRAGHTHASQIVNGATISSATIPLSGGCTQSTQRRPLRRSGAQIAPTILGKPRTGTLRSTSTTSTYTDEAGGESRPSRTIGTGSPVSDEHRRKHVKGRGLPRKPTALDSRSERLQGLADGEYAATVGRATTG